MRERFIPTRTDNKVAILNEWRLYYKKNYDPDAWIFPEEVREHFFYRDYGKTREEAIEFLSGCVATEELINYL